MVLVQLILKNNKDLADIFFTHCSVICIAVLYINNKVIFKKNNLAMEQRRAYLQQGQETVYVFFLGKETGMLTHAVVHLHFCRLKVLLLNIQVCFLNVSFSY